MPVLYLVSFWCSKSVISIKAVIYNKLVNGLKTINMHGGSDQFSVYVADRYTILAVLKCYRMAFYTDHPAFRLASSPDLRVLQGSTPAKHKGLGTRLYV